MTPNPNLKPTNSDSQPPNPFFGKTLTQNREPLNPFSKPKHLSYETLRLDLTHDLFSPYVATSRRPSALAHCWSHSGSSNWSVLYVSARRIPSSSPKFYKSTLSSSVCVCVFFFFMWVTVCVVCTPSIEENPILQLYWECNQKLQIARLVRPYCDTDWRSFLVVGIVDHSWLLGWSLVEFFWVCIWFFVYIPQIIHHFST